MSKLRNFFLRLFIVVAVCYLLYLCNKSIIFSLSDFTTNLKNINIYYISLLVPVLIINMLIRSYRWAALLGRPKDLKIYKYYKSIVIGNLANNILPARTGDIVRSYNLAKISSIKQTESLATVITERVFDLLFAGLLLLIISIPWLIRNNLITNNDAATKLAFNNIIIYTSILLVILSIIVFTTYYIIKNNYIYSIIKLLPRSIAVPINKLAKTLITDLTLSLKNILKKHTINKFILLTLAVWSAELIFLIIIAKSLNINLNLLAALTVMLITTFGLLIPGLPGNVGTFEFAAFIGMSAVGLAEQGLLVAITWHMIYLLLTSSLGMIELLITKDASIGV